MSPRSRVMWTTEMDAALREAAEAGEGDRTAADRIGVDRHTARHRRKELGLPGGRVGRPKIHDDHKIAAIGSTPIIAERLGLSPNAASVLLSRARRRLSADHRSLPCA